MPPKINWLMKAEFDVESNYPKDRWENFCCSVVFSVRNHTRIICPGDHDMAEHYLRCKSPTCDDVPGSVRCPVQWKVHHCSSVSVWVVLTNRKVHARGDAPCMILPTPRVTTEMREHIQRMDDSAVSPRLIWSGLLRAPEIPTPVLGFLQLSSSASRQIQSLAARIQELNFACTRTCSNQSY
jgi:hypothetical protein